jgi:hypothetical protein
MGWIGGFGVQFFFHTGRNGTSTRPVLDGTVGGGEGGVKNNSLFVIRFALFI